MHTAQDRQERARGLQRQRRRSIIPLSENHLRPCLDDRSVQPQQKVDTKQIAYVSLIRMSGG